DNRHVSNGHQWSRGQLGDRVFANPSWDVGDYSIKRRVLRGLFTLTGLASQPGLLRIGALLTGFHASLGALHRLALLIAPRNCFVDRSLFHFQVCLGCVKRYLGLFETVAGGVVIEAR